MLEKVELKKEVRVPNGKVKVELFRGSESHEIEKHNYVNENFLSGRGKINSRAGFNMTPINTANIAQLLTLTDNEKPVNMSDSFIEGNILGWADTANAPLHAVGLQGEMVESELTNSKQRRVWEFSETQANGALRSIYLGLARTLTNTAAQQPNWGQASFEPFFTLILPFTFHTLKKRNGKYYAVNSVRDLYVFDEFSFEEFATPIAELKFEHYQLPNFIINDFEVVGDSLYFVNNTTTVRRVDLANPSVVADSFIVNGHGTQTLRGIVYSKKRKQWFFRISRVSEDILVYDDNFHLLDMHTLSRVTQTQVGRGIHLTECENYLTFNREKLDLETGVTSFLNLGANLLDSINEYTKDVFYGIGNQSTTTGTIPQITNVHFFAPSNFLSRVLLDEPIFKDGTQRMRITYEYELPPLFD